jgi:hypothetical protein
MVNEFVHADYLLRWYNSEMLHQAPTSYEDYCRIYAGFVSVIGQQKRNMLGVVLDEQVNSCDSVATCKSFRIPIPSVPESIIFLVKKIVINVGMVNVIHMQCSVMLMA